MFKKLFQKKPVAKTGLSKEEIAAMLRIHPEQLAKFEDTYTAILEKAELSDNLFDQNAKQSVRAKDVEELRKIPEEIVERIVAELLDGTSFYSYEKGKIRSGTIKKEISNPVTIEEIQSIPEDYQPQLTGRYLKKDIEGESSEMVLYLYKKFLDEKNPKVKKQFYGMFRSGLDTLDLDPVLYEILGMNRNSIGHWFPRLVEGTQKQDFFKIPDTTIIKVPLPMLQLSRLEYESMTPTTLRIVDRFCQEAFKLDETKEYFIKTGTFSSKYDFRNAHVWKRKEVKELGEYLLFIQNQTVRMASLLSTPHTYGAGTTNEWVVREFIRDVEDNPFIYKGLSLHTEYRVFVDFDTKKVLGIANYWDPQIMRKRFGHEADADSPHNVHDYIVYDMHEPIISSRYKKNKELVTRKIEELIPHVSLTGQWSIDVMQNGTDFYIIDMALAANSALNECVPKGMLRKEEENWLPDMGGAK